MNRYILAVVVVLSITLQSLVTYAGGLVEPTYPPYCWVQPPDGTLWYPCDDPEVKLLECLNLMELAMKALDGSALGPSLQEDKVFKLWERAKQTCWSDLKDTQPKHYH